ncbi:unnamed protein product [Chironomus riparius]|uniref:Cytosolic endo-beta-N-acetylglucosaminidase TIM barrel domain-containing protein n=1 Tax=Chironomus riparius TaxID=315576 RepID=A0A9N9WT46_9DIPT|nr:unnamed protein product [Chironomus riparius]
MDSDTKLSIDNRPEVLVCHDYKGNYLDDKFIDGGLKWEDYRFYNWSVVDIFCYFSHNLVTIPTLQFINAAHRNGVKVIGTLIFEHDEGRKAINDMLIDKMQTEKVANALIDIAKRLSFEGWLLNVEVSVNPKKLPFLKHFANFITKKTHQEIKNGLILWYDSVSAVDGILHGQSELNSHNSEFFELCDGIITDYKWKQDHVERTSILINEKYPNRRKDVFFGIDIFGRGQIAGFRTNETLSISAAQNFSTSIFAPGWTMEHIDSKIVTNESSLNKEFLERNDQFWNILYKYFYIFGPKSLPFVTNFCIGSDAFNGGSCLSIDTNELTRIFTCELPCKDGLIFSFTFKKRVPLNDLEVHLNVLNTATNLGLKIVCKKQANLANEISSLKTEDVQILNAFLTNKGYTPNPEVINAWETQYFLLKFNKSSSKNIIVTDIGVKKIHKRKVFLGQIAFYSAIDFESDSIRPIKIEL